MHPSWANLVIHSRQEHKGKVCATCGKRFSPKDSRRRYCCESCRLEGKREQAKRYARNQRAIARQH